MQDDGAFAIAQALKANEDVTVTSINLGNNFLTKFGQVRRTYLLPGPFLKERFFLVTENLPSCFIQSALTDARDHVLEMTEKEVEIFF